MAASSTTTLHRGCTHGSHDEGELSMRHALLPCIPVPHHSLQTVALSPRRLTAESEFWFDANLSQFRCHPHFGVGGRVHKQETTIKRVCDTGLETGACTQKRNHNPSVIETQGWRLMLVDKQETTIQTCLVLTVVDCVSFSISAQRQTSGLTACAEYPFERVCHATQFRRKGRRSPNSDTARQGAASTERP